MSNLAIKEIKGIFNTESSPNGNNREYNKKENIKDLEKNLCLVKQVFTFIMFLCHQ